MNKLLKSIVAATVGVAMAIGVGVGLDNAAKAVYAEEASFVPADFSGQGTSGSGSAISATKSGVTFACNKGYGTTQIRCYSGGKITISSSSENITSIAFTFSGTNTGGLEASYTDLSTTSWEKTLSSQARIMECTVTYGSGSSTPEHGTIETDPLDVAEALEIIDDLADGATTTKQYYIGGYIASVIQAWSTQYNNVTYMLSDNADGSGDLLEVYRSSAADGTTGANITAGDQVLVHGKLQKYVKDNVVTPEVASGCSTAIIDDIGANPDVEIITVANIEGNPGVQTKTVVEVHAYASSNNSFIAKVTGVAEDMYEPASGRFHLVNPSTGDEIIVYGGYTDTSFQKTNDVYNTVAGSALVTEAIIGHNVTIYSTINVYSGVGQLKDALVVVGNACSSTVSASVAVNNDEMGSATLSGTSVAYGTEITVNLAPNSGYKVKSVEVQRASHKETVNPDGNGAYKFNAQTINEVFVAFEADGSGSQTGDAVEITLVYSNMAISGGFTTTAGAQSFVYSEDLSIAITNGIAGTDDDIRVYKGATITFTAQNGITSIEFTCTASGTTKYGPGCFTAQTGYSYDGTIGTWTGNATSVSFVASSNQVRFTKLVITYIPSSQNIDNLEEYLKDNSETYATLHGRETGTTYVEKIFANCGFTDKQAIDSIDVDSNVEFVCAKGGATVAPVYYENGENVRVYKNGTATVQAQDGLTAKIVKVEFTINEGSITYLSPSTGSFKGNIWEGDANSVTFTLSDKVFFTEIKVTYYTGSYSVDNVSIRFGASISQEKWNGIHAANENWNVTDYGVMMLKKSTLTGYGETKVADAYNHNKAVTTINIRKNGAAYAEPYPTGNSIYSFTARISFSDESNFDDLIVAAPFVVVSGTYYFLSDVELEFSVNTLAAEYVADSDYNGGASLSYKAMTYLSTAH